MVLLVIDQFRQDFPTRFRPFFGTGIRRLMEQGADFTNCLRARGHVYRAGYACIVWDIRLQERILANYWYNRARKQREAMVYDPDSQLLDGAETTPGDETSPRNLIGTALGDQLMLANGGQSRVIGLSNKDCPRNSSPGRWERLTGSASAWAKCPPAPTTAGSCPRGSAS